MYKRVPVNVTYYFIIDCYSINRSYICITPDHFKIYTIVKYFSNCNSIRSPNFAFRFLYLNFLSCGQKILFSVQALISKRYGENYDTCAKIKNAVEIRLDIIRCKWPVWVFQSMAASNFS